MKKLIILITIACTFASCTECGYVVNDKMEVQTLCGDLLYSAVNSGLPEFESESAALQYVFENKWKLNVDSMPPNKSYTYDSAGLRITVVPNGQWKFQENKTHPADVMVEHVELFVSIAGKKDHIIALQGMLIDGYERGDTTDRKKMESAIWELKGQHDELVWKLKKLKE